MLPITSVIAVTPLWGIGMGGVVPWQFIGKHLKYDVNYFVKCTKATVDPAKINLAIMGRKTWESIPAQNRPLKRRVNVIVSNSIPAYKPSLEHIVSGGISYLEKAVIVVKSFTEILQWAVQPEIIHLFEKVVVVGGVQLFDESFFHPWFDTLHLTQVHDDFECDTYLTPRMGQFLQSKQSALDAAVAEDNIVEDDVQYRIVEYRPQGEQLNDLSSEL